MEQVMEKEVVTGHSDLWRVVNNLEHEIRMQRKRHPRTKVWKDLLKMVEELSEIQKDWAERTPK